MAKITAADIIAALPQLSRQDRLAVRAAADRLLLGTGSQDTRAINLYPYLALACGSSMPFGRLPVALQSALAAQAEGVESFIKQHWPGQSKVVQGSIIKQLMGLLVASLRSRQIPVTVATLIRNLGSIQDVFDDNFPNYRQSGLCKLILNQWVK